MTKSPAACILFLTAVFNLEQIGVLALPEDELGYTREGKPAAVENLLSKLPLSERSYRRDT